jgi:hypothetical protein
MPYFGILGEEAYHVNKHLEHSRGEKRDGRKTIYHMNGYEMEKE